MSDGATQGTALVGEEVRVRQVQDPNSTSRISNLPEPHAISKTCMIAAVCSTGQFGLVAVAVRLVGPVLADTNILGLLVREFRQASADLVEVQACHLLVQVFR